MAEPSPSGKHDPKAELSEEDLDDFLAGAGTVSKDASPNPELILGEEITVPVVAGAAPLVKQTLEEEPASPAPQPPAPEAQTDTQEKAPTPAAVTSVDQVQANSTTDKTISDDATKEPIKEAAQTAPEVPTTTPPPKRKFSLRRLFGLKARQ